MKTAIIQVVVIVLAWGGYFAFRSSQPTQPSANSYDLLTQAGRTISFYAKDLRQTNAFIQTTVEKMVAEFHASNEVMKKNVQDGATVQRMTTDMLKMVEQLRNSVIEKAGGMNSKNGITNNSSVAVIDRDQLMETIVTLEKYREQVIALSKPELTQLLYDAKGNAVKPAVFANLYFASKPVALFLMNLARLEADLIEIEREALIEIGGKANYLVLEFDDLVPVVKPESSVVKNGGTYKAEISFARKLSNAQPSLMMVNGEMVKAEKGYGTIELEVKPPFTRNGSNQVKSVDAIITLSSKGGMRSFTAKEEVIIK